MINGIGIVLDQILSANISQEQKDALLGALGDEIINNKVSKSEELIEKNRQQASELRERLKEREKESYKKELETKQQEILGNKKIEDLQKEYEELIEKRNNLFENDYNRAYLEGPELNQKIKDLNKTINELKIIEEQLKGMDEIFELDDMIKSIDDEIPMENNGEDTVVENDLEKETFRELTFQEARSIINYGEMERNGKLDETTIIKFKPLIDDWMSQTGCKKMQELYDKASEVLRNHPFDIESSTLKKTEFSNKQDVSELNEEEKNYIRYVQDMDDNKEITNDDLHKVQSKLIAKDQEPKKPVKQIKEANDNIKQKINAKDKVIAAIKAVGAIAVTALAIASAGLVASNLIPGIAAGALGASAVHQYNKGKKL